MITYTGVHIQTIGGANGTPSAADIAVHAGRLCRFGGAVWYPLLPHLIFVGLLAYRRSGSLQNLLWGFLHDAHEAVTGDVPRPFKCDCMRKEQAEIDSRIFERFIGYQAEPLINYRLINECDHDACDLEAVELGIPNYQEIATAHAPAYKRARGSVIHFDAEDLALLRRILRSPFYQDTIYPNSIGVTNFAYVLSFAEGRKRDAIIPAVAAWGLLEVSEWTKT